jgi:WD40 repeat protein
MPFYSLKMASVSFAEVKSLLIRTSYILITISGDDERVRIFNTDSLTCEKMVNCEKWGQVTALTWVHVDHPIDEKSTSLCIGSARGFVTLWTLFKDIDDKVRRSSFSGSSDF